MRIRKINGKYEFTFKHFLKRENGMAIYDEYTESVSELFINDLLNKSAKLKILAQVYSKGDLYVLLTLKNKRTLYTYMSSNNKFEVMVEDLTYQAKDKIMRDAMLEIEVKECSDQSVIMKFCEKLKILYKGKVTHEGKNKRGQKLLNLELV